MRVLLVICFAWLSVQTTKGQPVFTEVSATIGIDHHAVMCDYEMPAQGGAAWFDYNNDGWYDLYLTGGSVADVLYRNNGDGTFSDVTSDAGFSLIADVYTDGVTTGDFNRDGWNDVLVTTFRTAPNYLFANNGDGTFSHVENWAGAQDAANSFSATFADLNMDGWLDLYVCNWSRFMEVSINGGNVSVDSEANYYYQNNGGSSFTERAQELGIDDPLGCGLGVIVTDYDNDHDPDVFVANDFGFFYGNTPNRLFRNDQAGQPMVEVSASIGLDVGMNGMGVARTDVNADGIFDYYITNIRDDKFMISNLTGYEDGLTSAGLHNDSVWLQDLSMRHWKVGWGVGFLDVDNDMDEDLMVANGSLFYDYPHPALDSNKLFLNDGWGDFSDISFVTGIADTYVSRALAYCDYDLDGDLDVFIGVSDSIGGMNKSFLYRNDSPVQHWLQVKATGVQNNTNGIGAKVLVYTDGFGQMREIGGESSFNSQHWQVAHFGLLNHQEVDSLDVIWYGGAVDRYYNVAADQFLEVIEGQGLITGRSSLSDDNFRAYPNPFNDILTLEGTTIGQVQLLDMAGKTQSVEILSDRKRAVINGSSLPVGNYLVKVMSENGDEVIHKVVKAQR